MVRKAKPPTGRYTNEADRFAGERLRIARLAGHVTQQALGDQLGLTFQQIQKYEKGANRISIGRLDKMARVLQVPVTYFFQIEGGNGHDRSSIQKMLTDPDVLKLAGIMAEIKDRDTRLAILVVARAVAKVS